MNEDIHGSMARSCASGKCGPRRPGPGSLRGKPENLEFFVRYPDGTDSDPQPSAKVAYDLAEATGGQARARVRVNPGQK